MQALFYGPMYAKGISEWIEKRTNALVMMQSKEVTYHLKRLEKEGMIEFKGEKKEEGRTRGTERRYYRITDKGRISIIALREALKMVFSQPPDEVMENYK